MNLIFSIMGLVGGLLCCAGDLLFDLKGKGNKKLGTSKILIVIGAKCLNGDLEYLLYVQCLA